ncbi:MAG: RusA family crossover junction endodeoxyribonuclease [Phycisphaerales bacterium]|nr:RusA family crossover junction endodeoxyribonuclease [Phycisphaerales bacterium]
MTTEFRIYGDPKPEPRPRAYRRGERVGVYAGTSADGWREQIATAARPHVRRPITSPVGVTVEFFIGRPKSHLGTGRNADKLKPSAPMFPAGKGRDDLDNLAKPILDVLTNVGMWVDDGQVTDLVCRKRYTTGQPGALVTITEIHE